MGSGFGLGLMGSTRPSRGSSLLELPSSRPLPMLDWSSRARLSCREFVVHIVLPRSCPPASAVLKTRAEMA